MTSQEINPVEFGKMLGQLEHHANDIRELKDGQRVANEKLDRLLEYQAKQKGAIHLLLMLSSALSALIGWAVSWFTRN